VLAAGISRPVDRTELNAYHKLLPKRFHADAFRHALDNERQRSVRSVRAMLRVNE